MIQFDDHIFQIGLKPPTSDLFTVFKVIFYGLYHGKSSLNHLIWDSIFLLFLSMLSKFKLLDGGFKCTLW